MPGSFFPQSAVDSQSWYTRGFYDTGQGYRLLYLTDIIGKLVIFVYVNILAIDHLCAWNTQEKDEF